MNKDINYINKISKIILSFIVLGLILLFPIKVHALSSGNFQSLELKPPSNTKCRAIDFTSDTHRTFVNTVGIHDTFYDLCIGSYPKFPSTSVEDGIEPFYYAKYRLFPDPMPIYEILPDNTTSDGFVIEGINDTYILHEGLEGKHVQRVALNDGQRNIYDRLFYAYPFNAAHADYEPTPKSTINGPYQIGYNEYYHNTYRARMMATGVEFDFKVLEPREGVTTEGHEDKTLLFAGKIYYEIPEECFRTDVLDYKDECREIEFYFPKTRANNPTPMTYAGLDRENAWDGIVVNEENIDNKSTNVIPTDRLPYNNPGEHILIFTATEYSQLRIQKDLGTEFQTIGNKANVQGDKPILETLAYFRRDDVNIDGSPITPILDVSKILEVAPELAGQIDGSFADSTGYTVSNDDLVDGHYEYNMHRQERFLNYCDKNTSYSGEVNTDYRKNLGSGEFWEDLDKQADKICYHHPGSYHHIWITEWSDTFWYAENPRSYSY